MVVVFFPLLMIKFNTAERNECEMGSVTVLLRDLKSLEIVINISNWCFLVFLWEGNCNLVPESVYLNRYDCLWDWNRLNGLVAIDGFVGIQGMECW